MGARRDLVVGTTLDGTGAGSAALTGPALHGRWLLHRATALTDETAGSADLRLYRNLVAPSTFLDGSSYARQDVAEWAPPITLEASESVVVVWTGGTAGAQAHVTLTVEVE